MHRAPRLDGGTLLLACAGSNGDVYDLELRDTEWTLSEIGNRPLPGVSPFTSIFTGHRWVVGSNSNRGVFLSPNGREPWTPSNTAIPGLIWATFAMTGEGLFGLFDTFTGFATGKSVDEGTTWVALDFTSGAFAYQLAARGFDLYAARSDGLWTRTSDTASVPDDGAGGGLRFALVGSQPVGNQVRLEFQLPEAGSASIEVFDVLGRLAAPRIKGSWSAGPQSVSVDASALAAGVYAARLTAGSEQRVVRLVRVR